MMRLAFPYLLFAALVLIVVVDRVGARQDEVVWGGEEAAAAEPGEASEVGRDVVCNMDVGGRIAAVYRGERYLFCMEACREAFLEEPQTFVRENCPVCRADEDALVAVAEDAPELTWEGTTYRFCGTAHRDTFAADPAGYFLHTMWGIPSWLYAVSVALLLLVSFGLFEVVARWGRRNGDRPPPRIDLFRLPGVASVLRRAEVRLALQVLFVGAFGMIVLAGLSGNQLASHNVAPLLTWTVWWGGLVVVILFLGKAWCYVCPWDAIAGWVERLGGGGLNLPWPRFLRNVWPATLLFVGLTWLELGFGVTMNPRATALLGLAMVSLAVVSVLVFERRAFCRYACLVGRVSGLYALFSATEVRPRDRDVCRGCSTKDCYHGNEKGAACPTGLFPGALAENTYCIDCLECVRTCPSDNMVVNARPWAADLGEEGRPRKDEAYLALLMLAITGFHGLTMTRAWRDLHDFLSEELGVGYVPAFTIGMLLLMLGPVAIYALLVKLTQWFARAPEVGYGRVFVRFAYSLLPIALFYHLAHNLEHLLMEGQKVVPLLSNPLGFAPGEAWSVLGLAGTGPWNLLGTADLELPPLVELPTLWILQVLLVLVGHVYSLWIADRTARRLYPTRGAAWRSQLPMLAGMILFSVFSLWLLKQPMEMRVSAM